MTMRNRPILFCLSLLLSLVTAARDFCLQTLPNQELLSSDKVLFVMQDSEGFLWYGTDGGGVCRDDGRQVDVFRSDNKQPDLLGSNSVLCLAEAGSGIVIGTTHGAYFLDKADYNIRRLTEVDDKRVDDIIVTPDKHWWLTANRKVYEYGADGRLCQTFDTGDKYIFRLHLDRKGRLWASQWEGGLLRLDAPGTKGQGKGAAQFRQMPWPFQAAPTAIADDPQTGDLWVGTVGQGIVRYHPDSGQAETVGTTASLVCTDMCVNRGKLWVGTTEQLMLFTLDGRLEPTSETIAEVAVNRLMPDRQGNLLVANGHGQSMAVSTTGARQGFESPALTRDMADSLRIARNLAARPAAFAIGPDDEFWYSTGGEIRCVRQGREDIVMSDTKDVSALAFSPDGTLWMATIYGQLYRYRQGEIEDDAYGSNEFGDGVMAMTADSAGRLHLMSERYVRIYDTARHTLMQQSREDEGTYAICLYETQPDQRWSRPDRETVVERLPHWVTSWWMLCLYALFGIGLCLLVAYNIALRRQRRRFLSQMKQLPQAEPQTPASEPTASDYALSETNAAWLQHAMAHVTANMSNELYTVEQLSSDMCMSRMTLYRKIQSVTGQKPTEFIRTIRLRHAAQLLREGRLTVSEISDATGFSSVSYFSRCFRTMFGVPPTQFGSTTTAADRAPSEMPS